MNWSARATSDFPEPVGGVEDDVVAGEEFEDGFFLVVVGLGAGGGEVVEEGVEDIVRGGVFGKVLVAERCGHVVRMEEEEFTAKAQRARRGAKFSTGKLESCGLQRVSQVF